MLSLYINAARIGSSRLAMLFREYGFKTYNEPFHYITENNQEKRQKKWGGDRKTIIENSNLNMKDITFDKDTEIKKKIYGTVLRAYAKAPKYYLIGLQPKCFTGIKLNKKNRPIRHKKYFTEFCSIYPCIFLQRKNIDIYISHLKSRTYISSLKSGSSYIWHASDTTEIKPKANAEEFRRLINQYSIFYNRCYSAVMNSHQHATIINYEDWANEPDHKQLEKIKFILSLNKTKFFKLPSEEYVDFPSQKKSLKHLNKEIVRQDNNLLWEEKISNYSEFICECKKLGIEEWINRRQINL